MLAHWDGHPLRGALGDLLRENNHDAFEAARKAPECLMLPDSPETCALLYHGAGCIHCGNTGYRGRLAVHEVMPMSPALRELIVQRASTADLTAKATRNVPSSSTRCWMGSSHPHTLSRRHP